MAFVACRWCMWLVDPNGLQYQLRHPLTIPDFYIYVLTRERQQSSTSTIACFTWATTHYNPLTSSFVALDYDSTLGVDLNQSVFAQTTAVSGLDSALPTMPTSVRLHAASATTLFDRACTVQLSMGSIWKWVL